LGKSIKRKIDQKVSDNFINFTKKEVTLNDIGEMPRRLVYIETMLEKILEHLMPEELEDLVSNEKLLEFNISKSED
jgi:hypothetical protein